MNYLDKHMHSQLIDVSILFCCLLVMSSVPIYLLVYLSVCLPLRLFLDLFERGGRDLRNGSIQQLRHTHCECFISSFR